MLIIHQPYLNPVPAAAAEEPTPAGWPLVHGADPVGGAQDPHVLVGAAVIRGLGQVHQLPTPSVQSCTQISSRSHSICQLKI